jgi:hypothetical protein
MQIKRELSLRVPLLHGSQRDVPLCGAINPGLHGSHVAVPSARPLANPGAHGVLRASVPAARFSVNRLALNVASPPASA